MGWGQRICWLLGLLVGLLGAVGCVALIVYVWMADYQLSQSVTEIADKLDNSLDVLSERVQSAEQRVDESRVTSEEIKDSLERWVRQTPQRQLAERLQLDEKAAQLSAILIQATSWLDASETTVELVGQLAALANQAGASFDTDSVDRLLAELGSLRMRMDDVSGMVTDLRDRMDPNSDVKTLRDRLERAIQLAVRVIATLGIIQERLRELDGELHATQADLQQAEPKLHRWIHFGAIGLTILWTWMLVGQLALFRLSWIRLLYGVQQG